MTFHHIIIQLTSQTYGEAVAMLSKFTEATANNTDVQTNEVLNEVATYFKELADFVNESQVMINMTVSKSFISRNDTVLYTTHSYYCSDHCRCCSCGEFLASVGTRKCRGSQQFKVSLVDYFL